MQIDNKLIFENSKSLNVLYVEDDDVLRKITMKLFSNYFNNVDVAVDGLDGLGKYEACENEHGVKYDIVITDLNMPNMDGLEMSQKIKKLYIKQVIIFVTAFNETQYLHDAVDLGVNGFLTKPIEVEQLKKVLYTTTQIVSDRKLVQEHYDQIESLNELHIDRQDASNFNSSKDILNDLEKYKELISKNWVKNQTVKERLEKHSIDVEFFRSHYGIKVIEYFLNVIKGKAEVGNCPVVFVMLEFFKNKDLALEDIFMICVNFKNTMTSFIFDKYTFNQNVFDDASYILDKNFEGVIINYIKNRYIDNPKVIIEEVELEEEVEEEKEEFEEINYTEYFIEADIYELQDLEDDIDSLAVSVTMRQGSSIDNINSLGKEVRRYGTILSNYPLFTKLGQSIRKLGENLSFNSELLFNEKDKMSNISVLFEGFVNDLIVWRKEIFDNNTSNPHFLDSSFFSNVDTIIMFVEYDESAENSDEGELEFF